MDDARSLFEWRNAPETREYFLDPRPMDWEQHIAWLSSALSSEDRHLLIGELDGEAIGVLRYDSTPPRAEVSIYLVPGRLGRGLGTALLEVGSSWIARHVPTVTELHARILPDNLASRKAFLKAGFKRIDSEYVRTLKRRE